MGACCSRPSGRLDDGLHVDEEDEEREANSSSYDIVPKGSPNARVLLQGSSKCVSMFSKKGKKATNQDAMTVWESFSGEKDMVFCGVFDGHGPSGHKVSQYIRDFLPAKLYMLYKQSRIYGRNAVVDVGTSPDEDPKCRNPLYLSWKARLTRGFKEIDDQLERERSIDSYGSGTTSVCALKKGEHLVIANLGDSRAILGTRDENDQLVSEQLTVDLKPSVPSEAARIRSHEGRVLAMAGEPNVYRVWMPKQDSPGLAMARSFGDFCLKDYGVISTPQVTYRKITKNDEFIVLASDGIWDVLSNNKVVKIVSSAKNQSMAAKLLVEKAVKCWKFKYPRAKVDDCTAVCLFFKRDKPELDKSHSETNPPNSLNRTEMEVHSYSGKSHDAMDIVVNCKMAESSIEGQPGNDGDQEEGSSVACPK